MASIKQRGDSYLITVSLGRDINGKKLFETTTYTPTATTPKKIEKEVAAFAQEFENTVLEGKYLPGEKITFARFMDTWFEDWAKLHLTFSVQEDYTRILRKRVLPFIGNMKLAKIQPIHIQKILTDLIKAGKAAKTVKYTFTCINSVMKYAYRMKVIEENPCSRCELPKDSKKKNELHYFTLEQAKTFLNALDMEFAHSYGERTRISELTGEAYSVSGYEASRKIPLQFKCFFYLAIYGGFRRGELCALKWEDVDSDNQIISIRHAIAKTETEGQIEKDPKTAAGIRDIVLPKKCFDLLAMWKREQRLMAMQSGECWMGKPFECFNENYIFIQPNSGLPMNVDTPYHKFKEICEMYNATVEREEDKLPNIRLHDLRHTSATLLLSENVDIETVAHRLGHSKASVTLDIYGHALETKDVTASDKLERLFA